MIASIEKAYRILDRIGQSEGSMALSEIAAACDLPVTTASTIVRTLRDLGLLVQEPATRRYMLGPELLRLSEGVKLGGMLHYLSRSILYELSRETGATAHLVHRVGLDVEFISQARPAGELTVRFPQKSDHTHGFAMGKVLLAYAPQSLVEQYIEQRGLPKITSQTITDASVFRKELKRIRQRGWADCIEESTAGVIGWAIPIFGPKDRFLAAMGIARPAAGFDKKEQSCLLEKLKQAGKKLSEHLGKTSIGNHND